MIEKFCDGEFWDWNESWNKEVPDFTPCFHDIVLTALPCTVFSIILSYQLFKLETGNPSIPLPWTWRNISRVAYTFILLLINKLWLAVLLQENAFDSSVPKSQWFSTCSKIIVMVLVLRITLKYRLYGVITSHVLSCFWLIYSLCSIFVYRSVIITGYTSMSHVVFYFHMLHHPIVFIQLVLSVFVDKRRHDSLQGSNIMDDVSLFSSATYLWFSKFIFTNKMDVKDFLFKDKTLTATHTHTLFSKHWNHYLSKEPHQSKSLIWSLVKMFWHKIVAAAVLNLIFIVTLILPALLLDRIIKHANDDNPWKGYFFGFLTFLTDFIGKMVHNNFLHFMHTSRIQLHSALTGAVFRKNLAISRSSRKEYDSGSLMNLMSVDIKRVQFLGLHVISLINAPLKIALIVYLLWLYLGKASLAGVAVILFLLPFSYVVSLLSKKFSVKQMRAKDERLKYTNEFLEGIKILKLYAWEMPFANRISEARKNELRFIRYSLLAFVVSSFAFFCAPFMVSLAAFTTFLMIDSHNTLDPITAFVSLTLISQLRYALYELPDSISELIQCSVSLKRLKKFFICENKDETIVGSNTGKGEAINIQNASFSCSRDSDSILHNINLSIQRGTLIAVTGPVGSGKSSLFSAILGEMHLRNGSIDVRGSIAYVPQQPWLLNRSLRENILLIKRMKDGKYDNIVQLCCLNPDIESLQDGDKTEIGEKGANLSGGQKLRVNLAQAVYQDREIYLLDDPLSAVDVHVRKLLFNDVIGREGLLKDKTRLLITHDTTVLSDADLIMNMRDGRIAGMGTYEDLIQQDGSFADFVDEQFQVMSSTEQCHLFKKTVFLRSHSEYQSSEHEEFNVQCTSSGNIYASEGRSNEIISNTCWKYVKKVGTPLFALSSFWYIAYMGLSAGANVWLSEWSEDVAHGIKDDTFWRLCVYGGYGFAQVISIIMASSLLVWGTTRAAAKYHADMLQSIMKSPMSFFDNTPIGRIINRFTSDMDTLDVTLFYKLNAWLSCMFSTITAFMIIGVNIPMFYLVFSILGLIYYCLQTLHLNTFCKTKRLECATRSSLYSLLMESIHGYSSISAYKIKNDFIKNFQDKIDYHSLCMFNSQSCDRWLNFWLGTFNSLIVLLVCILAVRNRATLGSSTIGLLVTYAYIVTESLKWLISMNTELGDNSISIERIDEYCHLESEGPWDKENESVPEKWPCNGRIKFHNYSSKYKENFNLVLKDINFSIEPSEKVGIVGRTAAGKSSVALALFRIIEPVSGAILIDDVDISKIGLHTLRSKVTIIPQEPVLFTGSIRMNLDPKGLHTDIKIWESLDKTYLKPFVSSSNKGLEYTIEENGLNLSTGQKQLLCLARALLKNTKILVMDEATASIDEDTELLIQKTIRTEFSDCSIITIAHRLNTVHDYDKIVVLESGRIVEVGKPLDLLKDYKSKFYQMNQEAEFRS